MPPRLVYYITLFCKLQVFFGFFMKNIFYAEKMRISISVYAFFSIFRYTCAQKDLAKLLLQGLFYDFI